MKGSRVIVTGGSGFIGSHIVDFCVLQNCKVLVVDNLSTGSIENHNSSAEYLIKPLNLAASEIKLFKPEYIFHLAALPRIQPSFIDPISHDDANVRSSLELFDAIKDLRIKALVNSSSSSCYGNPKTFPTDENASIAPLNPYALQKYTSERYLHILGEKCGIPVVSLRYFNAYGPRSFNINNPFNVYSSVVGIFANNKLNKKISFITGDGTQKRDFIHVYDIVSANIIVAEKIIQTAGKVYNVGFGRPIDLIELAQLFDLNFEFIPAREGEAVITHSDNRQLRNLGWSPSITIESAIEMELL